MEAVVAVPEAAPEAVQAAVRAEVPAEAPAAVQEAVQAAEDPAEGHLLRQAGVFLSPSLHITEQEPGSLMQLLRHGN